MGTGWSSTLPQRESVGVTPEIFFEKLLSKSCFSCAVSAKTLASVGVKYGTMKREKMVRHNRMKWRRLACWGTAGAQRFTAGTEALSDRPLAPLMRNNDWDTNYDASTLDSTTMLWRTKSSATQRPVMLSGTAWWERMDSVAAWSPQRSTKSQDCRRKMAAIMPAAILKQRTGVHCQRSQFLPEYHRYFYRARACEATKTAILCP